MSSLEERESRREMSNKLLELAANGNGDALEYLVRLSEALRLIDDLYDRDHYIDNEKLLSVFRWLLIECYQNKFYLQNVQALVSNHALFFSAWEESNNLYTVNDEVPKMYAHVLKDFCLSTVSLVANITGGYSHMKEVNHSAWRLYMKPLKG